MGEPNMPSTEDTTQALRAVLCTLRTKLSLGHSTDHQLPHPEESGATGIGLPETPIDPFSPDGRAPSLHFAAPNPRNHPKEPKRQLAN